MRDPVVPLTLALYGHPDADGYWEAHCEKALLELGYEKAPQWRSTYLHRATKAMLVVYVDDFNLAATKQHSASIWSDLRKNITMDDPGPPGRFLGCYREKFEAKASSEPITKILRNNPELHPRGA